MKKGLIYFAVVALFGSMFFSCAKGTKSLENERDSISYIIGLSIGENLLRMDSTLNVEAVCRAIADTYNGTQVIDFKEGRDYFLALQTYFVHERAQSYQEQFLADWSKRNRSYVRTRNGVTYRISKLGDQSIQSMVTRDTIKLVCSILDQEGNTLRDRDTLRLAYRDFVEGLQEVIKVSGDGAIFDAWLPSVMAYDTAGNDSLGIAPNQLLHYEVEILKIDYYNASTRRN